MQVNFLLQSTTKECKIEKPLLMLVLCIYNSKVNSAIIANEEALTPKGTD